MEVGGVGGRIMIVIGKGEREVEVCLLLFYTIGTLFQLCHGSDFMYEIRRRKPEPTLLPTQRYL